MASGCELREQERSLPPSQQSRLRLLLRPSLHALQRLQARRGERCAGGRSGDAAADVCAANASLPLAVRGPSRRSAADQPDAPGVSGRSVSAELLRVVRAL